MSEVQETSIADDIEAAFASLESKETEDVSRETPETPVETEESVEKSEESVAEGAEPGDEKAEPEEKASENVDSVKKDATADKSADALDPAPAGWRPAAREAWKNAPKEVREEALRREREISTTMQQLTDVRKFADNFAQVIYPFRDNIRREGANPLSAVQSLMQVAANLQTGSASGKAAQIAELVHRYGVDISALDEALATGVGREAPQVQQRIADAVKPYQEMLSRQQQEEQQRRESSKNAVLTEIQQFRADPKNEFFEDVRQDMADLMDAAARRGQTLSFADAYKRACDLHPEVSQVLRQRADAESARKAAAEAQAKRRAAKSLPSASSGDSRRRAADPGNPHDDMRADLEAAMSAVSR